MRIAVFTLIPQIILVDDSTVILTLNVYDDYFYVPNTFTPNTIDNINDRFFISNNFKDIKKCDFNRWGEKIFYTENGQMMG